jgi:RNase P subunit RPR2
MNRELEISKLFCKTCQKERPYTEFYGAMQKGRVRVQYMCKSCKREYNAEYRKKQKEISPLKMRAAKIGRV